MLYERHRVYGRDATDFARRNRVPAELLTCEVHDDGSKVVDHVAGIERAEELAAADPQLVWFEWPEAERCDVCTNRHDNNEGAAHGQTAAKATRKD